MNTMKTIEIKYYHNPKLNWNSTKPFKDSIELTKRVNVNNNKGIYTLSLSDGKGGPVISNKSYDEALKLFMDALTGCFAMEILLSMK